MWFNLFKHKEKEEEPREFEGRVVSDDEIYEMIRPKTGTFIKKELGEIDEMMKKIRNYPNQED